jgi:two-component system response regulator DegU
MTVRIILCDDHKIVRAGIRQLIEEANADIDVVAEGDDGIELIKLVQKFMPDLVITDIMMPSLNKCCQADCHPIPECENYRSFHVC